MVQARMKQKILRWLRHIERICDKSIVKNIYDARVRKVGWDLSQPSKSIIQQQGHVKWPPRHNKNEKTIYMVNKYSFSTSMLSVKIKI